MLPTQRPFFALGLRLGAAAAFATMAMLVKVAGESGIALPEIMFWRQAVPIPALLGWLVLTGGIHRLRTARLASHGRRAMFGMVGMLCTFGAIVLLPLAESTTISFTVPLFAVLFAALWLRERIGRWRWSAVALGFTGVLIIAQPGGGTFSLLGAASGLAAALIITVVNFQLRELGRTEEPIRTVFYFAAFGAPIAALALPFTMTAHAPWQWLVLIGVGLTGTLGQLLMTASVRRAAVASVIVMDYSSLIWATLFGWLVWQRLPAVTTWLGAPLIVAAGLLIAWREHRLAKTPTPPSAFEQE